MQAEHHAVLGHHSHGIFPPVFKRDHFLLTTVYTADLSLGRAAISISHYINGEIKSVDFCQGYAAGKRRL